MSLRILHIEFPTNEDVISRAVSALASQFSHLEELSLVLPDGLSLEKLLEESVTKTKLRVSV